MIVDILLNATKTAVTFAWSVQDASASLWINFGAGVSCEAAGYGSIAQFRSLSGSAASFKCLKGLSHRIFCGYSEVY